MIASHAAATFVDLLSFGKKAGSHHPQATEKICAETYIPGAENNIKRENGPLSHEEKE